MIFHTNRYDKIISDSLTLVFLYDKIISTYMILIKESEEFTMAAKAKTRVIGTESYINSQTGELIEMNVIETDMDDRDTNFHKLFMKDFINALDLVGNKKTKICYWVIDNINKDNMLLYSYRDIADKTGMSYQTVALTIKALIDADFLKKTGKFLIVNPDIIFKGTYARRQAVLHKYTNADGGDKEANLQMRIENIQQTISGLNKQLETLLRTSKAIESSATEESDDVKAS